MAPWQLKQPPIYSILFYSPLLRLPQFVLGIGACLFYRELLTAQSRRPWICTIAPGITVVALVLCIVLLQGSGSYTDQYLLGRILAPFFALLICSLALNTGIIAAFLALPAVGEPG